MTPLKEKVILAAIQRQEAMINDYDQRIKDATANEGNVNEEEYDNQKQAFQAQVMSEVSLLSEQRRQALGDLEDLIKLKSLTTEEENVVGFGKVVKTDQRTFFVSTGLEEFIVNGQTIFGVSIHSPVYASMRGKKAGERFTQSGISYTIREVL